MSGHVCVVASLLAVARPNSPRSFLVNRWNSERGTTPQVRGHMQQPRASRVVFGVPLAKPRHICVADFNIPQPGSALASGEALIVVHVPGIVANWRDLRIPVLRASRRLVVDRGGGSPELACPSCVEWEDENLQGCWEDNSDEFLHLHCCTTLQ